MLPITNTLILEENLIKRNELILIFKFIGEALDVVDFNQSINEVNLKRKRYKAIILGHPYNAQEDLPARYLDYLYYVKKLDCSNYILLVDGELQNNLSRIIKRMVSIQLNWPITYYNLILALKNQVTNNSRWPQKDNLVAEHSKITFVGQHQEILKVNHLVKQVAKTEAPVLLRGESGTGKEIIAKQIHHFSECKGSFVPINCAAIPSELLESELFGHEKGSFTGAVLKRIGKFEKAEKGTLFLDEIGDMPTEMQVKLLRVLQEKVFERVGGNKLISTNVRIIAATNGCLEDKIKTKKFREDLFYRLNVFPIFLLPLRERTSDISLLIADYLQRKLNKDKKVIHFLPEALNVLSYYNWPGNVRELYNLLDQLSILYPGGKINVEHLPARFLLKDKKHSESHCLTNNMEEIEKKLIQNALRYCQGETKTAISSLQASSKKLLAQSDSCYVVGESKENETSTFN